MANTGGADLTFLTSRVLTRPAPTLLSYRPAPPAGCRRVEQPPDAATARTAPVCDNSIAGQALDAASSDLISRAQGRQPHARFHQAAGASHATGLGDVSITAIADALRSLCHGCDSRRPPVAVTAGDHRTLCSPQPAAADRRPRIRGVAPPRRTNLARPATPISFCCFSLGSESCPATMSDSATIERVVRVVRPEGVNGRARSRCWRLPYGCWARNPMLIRRGSQRGLGRPSAVIAGATVTDSTVSVISRRQAR